MCSKVVSFFVEFVVVVNSLLCVCVFFYCSCDILYVQKMSFHVFPSCFLLFVEFVVVVAI
jgi:hypothetical protein